ncbi:TPA: hypothetical protein ACH3X2_004435 [Trebouxia sp. C0005]
MWPGYSPSPAGAAEQVGLKTQKQLEAEVAVAASSAADWTGPSFVQRPCQELTRRPEALILI